MGRGFLAGLTLARCFGQTTAALCTAIVNASGGLRSMSYEPMADGMQGTRIRPMRIRDLVEYNVYSRVLLALASGWDSLTRSGTGVGLAAR
jgi:hypothetical protein